MIPSKIRSRLNISMLLITLTCTVMGCSKSSAPTPAPAPAPTPTPVKTSTYTDPAAYGVPYSGVPATKDIVMYEVNIRSFSSTSNFAGVAARLDSIKALGVNTIWLMPIYPVGVLKSAGGLGSPYSVKDYNGVNTEFGSLTDLRNLIALAHTKGMAVIFDWVANHTSWDNAWIANKSWYQQDASGNIISPVGSGWNDVAALNYASTDMRTAMIRAMKFWVLTANIDGYRCDAADLVPADFWTQTLDTLNKFTNRKLIFLAEGTQTAQFTAGFQLDYAFSFYSTLKGIFAGTQAPSALFTTDNTETGTLAAGGEKLRYITNHDVNSSDGPPINVYKGKQGSLAAFVLASTMNGVPLIYNGQEVGTNKTMNIFNADPIDWSTNPDMTAEYKRIIAFRSGSNALKSGALKTYNNTDIIAFEKTAASDDVLVLVNARNNPVTYTIPANLQNTAWTNGLTGTEVDLSATYNFSNYGYLILRKK